MSPGGFSPSGDILYYSRSESGATDVYALPIGARSAARVATGAISTSPTVSPDGTLMAFVSDRHGSPGIFVKELGKPSSERQITPPGKFSTSPCWSPAGDLIAFTNQEKGRFSLMLVRPDGSELRQLLTGGGDYIDPTFSPDGRFVAYTFQEKGRSELRIVSVDGRFSRRVFSALPGIGSPSWSPRR
jgi:TolB protein